MKKTDLFSLQCSQKFQIQSSQAVRIDMGLNQSLAIPGNGITGQVVYNGRPIRNATVVVVDAQLNPVTYTWTNQDGIYLIVGLNSQLYGLTATSTGFSASDIIFIFPTDSKIKITNIELQKPHRRVFIGCNRSELN